MFASLSCPVCTARSHTQRLQRGTFLTTFPVFRDERNTVLERQKLEKSRKGKPRQGFNLNGGRPFISTRASDSPLSQKNHRQRRIQRTDPSRHCEHTKLGHASEQKVQGHMTIQGNLRKLPFLKEEGSPRLTSSHQRHTRQGFQHCVHTVRTRTCPLVQEATSLSQSGLFGQPYLHKSLKSGDMLPLDMEMFSPAIMRKPINAHAFNVSAETPGHRLCESESSPCGPYFPGTFRTLAVVRKPRTSHRSRNGQTPSQQSPSHIF